MVVGAIIVVSLLDNVQASVKPWQKEQPRISDPKIILKMKGIQNIAEKIHANISRSRSGRILKLVAKNVKKYKIFVWHTINELN